MEFSEYENIEIFNKTQRFSINKCEKQLLGAQETIMMIADSVQTLMFSPVF